jgi:hypothetical protein
MSKRAGFQSPETVSVFATANKVAATMLQRNRLSGFEVLRVYPGVENLDVCNQICLHPGNALISAGSAARR